jgi:hypothetical protein
MRRLTRRSWIAVGVAVIGDAVAAEVRSQGTAVPRIGTGGEPYLRDGGPSDTRTLVTRDLILLDGCLRVFDERVAANDWAGARQRIDDATLEHRESVEPYMKGQGIKPFTPLIEEMIRAIERREARSVRAVRARLQTRHDEADRALRKFRVPFHQFALRGSIEALKVAAKGYAAAYEAGDDPQTTDYLDGRGAFAAVAATIHQIRTELERLDPLAAAKVDAALASLKPVWSATVPPKGPVVPAETVDALVEVLDTAAIPFWTNSPLEQRRSP